MKLHWKFKNEPMIEGRTQRLLVALIALVGCCANVAHATDPPITSVVFSPDATSVIACSQAGVTVYSWPDLKPQVTFESASPNIHDLEFSPAGDRLAIAGGTPAEDGTVEILSWPNCKSLRVLNGHFDSVMAVCWIDSTILASASLDHDVIIWNTENGQQTRTLRGHSRGVTSLDSLDAQDFLVSAGIDQSLRVWDTASGKLVRSMAIHVKPVNRVSVRPISTGLPMIASASDDRSVRFWQPTIGRMVRFARLPSRVRDISWFADGSQIAACCDDGQVYLIDPDTVEVIKRYPAIDGWAYTLAVHPTDRSLVVGGVNGTLNRIDLN